MGMSSMCCLVILPRPIMLILQAFDLLSYGISVMLFRLGLTNSIGYYPFISLPSIANNLIAPPSSSIKSRLRHVMLSDLWLKKGKHDRTVVECAVCLRQLKATHEVRELGNCSHLFHTECIDKWVDLGKVSCPLCRAHLLPESRGGNGVEWGSFFDSVRWWN